MMMLAALCLVALLAGQEIAPVPPEGMAWHQQLVARAKKGDMGVVFFGDSGTAGWAKTGAELWKSRFEPLRAANFGINGNGVGNLLWRLRNGELEGDAPKVAVIWIGHVDLLQGRTSPEAIAEGIMACVREIRQRQPETKVLLMALLHASFFPNVSEKQTTAGRKVNELLAKQADGKKVRLVDLNDRYVEKKDELLKELQQAKDPHLLTTHYRIWADGIQKPLEEMLR
jgi:beta-glucosidase